MMFTHSKQNPGKRRNRGFTLIEVLIGILVFAIGMMALAKLQGNLARSSGDSNARTVAANIAEELIEQARVFSQIDSATGITAYNDIVDYNTPVTITRGGNQYRVMMDVTDYYIAMNGSVSTSPFSDDVGRSDFKQVDLTVTWNSAQQFEIDESQTTSGQLGSGSIRITDVISSITSASGGKVAVGATGNTSYAPPVNYNPGENPDIISIRLGSNKFKESTTPLPDVIRADELVETRFDVVTYSQDDSGATFLRREEFRAVSCVCELQIPNNSSEGGLRPTIWNGSDYDEGEFVSKPYGESANNQQSQYCTVCCRDHHDGGTGADDNGAEPGRSLYNPFRYPVSYYGSDTAALEGDHKHYDRNRQGELILADSDGDIYDEACRMVRKDGFWRIAQDLRQEGFNAFPASYLDEDTEVGVYSRYVTDAISAYELATDPSNSDHPGNNYEASPPSLARPANMTPPLIFPASTIGTATQMAVGGVTEQQLRARGIYLDYMTDELRERINCLDNGGDGADCDVPDVTTALEIIPFYDVQLTWLARWNETPNNYPIDVSNQAIADDNSHSRGVATLEAGVGLSTITTSVQNRNLGLTGTDPIDPWYQYQVADYNIYALATDFSTPPQPSGNIVSGQILSSVSGLKAADVEIVATGAQCDRTLTGYECVINATATNPRLTVSNYFKRNKVLLACSTMSVNGTEHSGDTPSQNWTRFNLPTSGTVVIDIVIKEDSCG